MKRFVLPFVLFILINAAIFAQQKQTDANAPLHTLQPDYPVPYKIPVKEDVKKVLDKCFII